MIIFRYIIVIVTLFLSIPIALAYETDYAVNGRFLVEATQASSGRKSLELWNVDFLRGHVPEQPPITDLEIVRISLRDSGFDAFTISDISTVHFDQNNDKVLAADGNFTFSIGFTQKHNLKLSFAADGSLKDLSGSLFSETDPGNVVVFKLFGDAKNITVKESYQLQPSGYYHQRSSK